MLTIARSERSSRRGSDESDERPRNLVHATHIDPEPPDCVPSALRDDENSLLFINRLAIAVAGLLLGTIVSRPPAAAAAPSFSVSKAA